MIFSGIRPLRQRVAVMSALLMLPLALIVGVNVAITYSKVRETLESVPMSAAVVSRQAIYATLVGAARYGVAVGDGLAQGGAPENFLERSLAHNPGYAAIRVKLGDASRFSVRPQDRAQANAIAAVLDAQAFDAPDLDSPNFPAKAWFRPLTIGDGRAFGVRVRYDVAARPTEVVIVIGGDMMRRVLDAIDDQSGAQITLLDDKARPLAASANEGWLPGPALTLADADSPTISAGRDGVSRLYAVRRLAGPHAYVVAALDTATTSSLRAQLPVAFFVPLLALGLISLAFMRSLKVNVVDWVYGLDRDVRRSTADAAARAIVSTRMPIEIENVARSFNDVLDARNAREAELSNALARNRVLTRELHHRVKNSLQLVQSYLALGAREAKDRERVALAAAQCRAYILSSAYRRALAEGEMRPFDVDAFLADVSSYSAEVLRAPDQRVERDFDTGATAGIDESLPLGMILVELIENGLKAPGARVVFLSVRRHDGSAALILAHVEAHARAAAPPRFPAPGRLLVGLLRQVGATPVDPPEGASLAYRFELPTLDPAAEAPDPTHATPNPRVAGNQTPSRTL